MDSGSGTRTDAFEGASLSLAELSLRAGKGDEGAFAALHRRVGAGLKRMLLKRCGGREDIVEDLSQKTWAAVWKSLSEQKYDPSRAAITTFVYAVGHNAWLTHLRQYARQQQGAEELRQGAKDEGPVRERGASALLAEAEMIEGVRACLRDPKVGGLTELERTIVHAIALGEGDRQLARRLGMSGSTINKHKHNGYAKIRTYLATRGFAELPGVGTGDAARSVSKDSSGNGGNGAGGTHEQDDGGQA